VVTALRIAAWVVLALAAIAGVAWLVADRQATKWCDEALAALHLTGIITAEHASLPTPDTVHITGARLHDEVTGLEVGYVEDVKLRLALPGLGGVASVTPLLFSGTGGRVLLSLDGDTFVFARAIEIMLDHIFEAIDSGGAAEAPAPAPTAEGEAASADERQFLPPMEFRDIEITLRLQGLPDVVIPDSTAFLQLRRDGIFSVDIDVGRDGGHVLLEFDDDGLHRLQTRNLAINPTFALFLPDQRELLAEHVAPEGLLDLEASGFNNSFPLASGVLRQGTLRPPIVPFPVTQVTLPFELRDDHVRVTGAALSFEGGAAVASFDYGPEKLVWNLDVVNAEFKAVYLSLLPDDLDLSWVTPEDGGNLELHLRVETPLLDGDRGVGTPAVTGWGGILVNRLYLGPTHVEVQDMVSRFDLADGKLIFQNASGRCASGVVALKGSLNLDSGDIDGSASIYDVDIARMRRALDPGTSAPLADPEGHVVSGWLQGDVTYKGSIGNPKLATGRGQFSVRGGSLWHVPVLDAILDALRLAPPGGSERQRLTVVFDIDGRKYNVRLFKLESQFLSLVGDGKVNRDDTLEVNIVPIKVPLGYVGDLIEYIQSQVVRIELRGTLTDPKVSVVPVQVVTKNVGRFWDWLGGMFSSKPEPVSPPFEPLPPLTVPAAPVPAAPGPVPGESASDAASKPQGPAVSAAPPGPHGGA